MGTKASRYNGFFLDYASMVEQWPGSGAIADEDVVYAEYDYEDYSGNAWCVYRRDGKIFEVHDGHCSCYGLDTWEPEETTLAAIEMRPGLSDAAKKCLAVLR